MFFQNHSRVAIVFISWILFKLNYLLIPPLFVPNFFLDLQMATTTMLRIHNHKYYQWMNDVLTSRCGCKVNTKIVVPQNLTWVADIFNDEHKHSYIAVLLLKPMQLTKKGTYTDASFWSVHVQTSCTISACPETLAMNMASKRVS